MHFYLYNGTKTTWDSYIWLCKNYEVAFIMMIFIQ